MKASILFCCLMVVGGLAFGQQPIPFDPGDNTSTPTVVVSPPTPPGSSGGTTVSSGSSSGGWFFSPDSFDELADFFMSLAEAFYQA